MLKLLGGALVATAAALLYGRLCATARERITMLQDCQAALEDIAAGIRWLKLPLPELIRRQTARPNCGVLFRQIEDALASGVSLDKAWQAAFSGTEPAAHILCRMEFGGDEAHLLRQLDYVAGQIEREATQLKQKEQAVRRVRLGALFSGAGLLVILLM